MKFPQHASLTVQLRRYLRKFVMSVTQLSLDFRAPVAQKENKRGSDDSRYSEAEHARI